MSLDHAQSLRLGQKGVAPTPGVQLVALASLPEVAYRGQIVYLLDLDEFRVYDGDAWQVPTAAVQAGTQTFVGPDAPVADRTGDLWMKTTTYQLYIWDGTTWRLVQDPNADLYLLYSKRLADYIATTYTLADLNPFAVIWYTATDPAPIFPAVANQDWWFQTSTNQLWRRIGGAWIANLDAVQIFTDAGTAQSTADQSIRVHVGSVEPWPDATPGHGDNIGDLWFDESDSYKPYRWNGAWVSINDVPSIAAQIAADAAQGTANQKISSYYQPIPPWPNGTAGHDLDVGDLWFDQGDNNICRRWFNNAWTLVQDQGIPAAQATADQKISSYYQSAAPWPDGATNHSLDVGDLWFKTPTNEARRWDVSNVWVLVQDTGISQALTKASTDGLGPASSPTPVAVGGLGAVFLRWDPVANRDPCQFRLYTSTSPGVTIDAAHLVVTTAASSYTHRPTNPDYTGTYYYRLVQFDADAPAPASAEVSAQLVQVNSPDVAAAYIYAGTLTVDNLRGGSLSAEVLLSGVMRTGLTGARVETGGFGINIYDPNNKLQTQFPSDGTASKFKGNVEADGLTINGTASFRDTGAHEIAKNAAITLRAKTTAPSQAPTKVVDWPSVAIDGDKNYGLVLDGGTWITLSVDPSGAGCVVLSYPTTGGSPSVVASPFSLGSDMPYGGLTRLGSNWFTLTYRVAQDRYMLSKFDLSWNLVDSISYAAFAPFTGGAPASISNTRGGSVSQGLAPASIGNDGTSVLTAEWDNSATPSRYQIAIFNPATLGITSKINTTTQNGFSGPVVAISGGNFDFGAARYVITARNSGYSYVFTTTGTYQGVDSFAVVGTNQRGQYWDGTRFYTSASGTGTTKIYQHGTYFWTGLDPQTWYAASTWRGSGGASGTIETNMSPSVTIAMKKRARLTLTTTAIPDGGAADDAKAAGFYLSDSTNTQAAMWRQTLPADGVNTLTLFDAYTFSGANPPTASNFPVTTAARIRNTDDSMYVSGDGSAKFVSAVIGVDPVVSQAATQTLTNKNLASATNTLPADLVTAGAAGLNIRGGTVNSIANSSTVTVTHGLGTTPTFVVVTTAFTTGVFWAVVTSRNATTFTIQINNTTTGAASAPTTAQPFSWFAGA